METKWTPGPWKAEFDEYGDEIWFGGPGKGTWSVGPAYLGGLGPNDDGLERMKADASLISAAPELLEAVETLLDCFVNDPLGWMDSSDIAIEKAYDAIHKAKGE